MHFTAFISFLNVVIKFMIKSNSQEGEIILAHDLKYPLSWLGNHGEKNVLELLWQKLALILLDKEAEEENVNSQLASTLSFLSQAIWCYHVCSVLVFSQQQTHSEPTQKDTSRRMFPSWFQIHLHYQSRLIIRSIYFDVLIFLLLILFCSCWTFL